MTQHLAETPTHDLFAELARRAEPDATILAREILVRCASQAGLSPPLAEQGLAEWADETLDGPLAPRGGNAWLRGHGLLMDALESALEGEQDIVLAALRAARDEVSAYGRKACVCVASMTIPDALGRALCVRCSGRRA